MCLLPWADAPNVKKNRMVKLIQEWIEAKRELNNRTSIKDRAGVACLKKNNDPNTRT